MPQARASCSIAAPASQGTDEAKRTISIEVLAWKDYDAPETVRRLWDRLQALVEPRLGHRGIEFPEVEVLTADGWEKSER